MHGSEYAWSTYYRVLNTPSALNMPEYGEIVNMRGLHSVQDKPEYALKNYQYAWICLNNSEYDWICLHILGQTEYVRILIVPDAVHSIRSLYKLLSSCKDNI